MQHALQHLELFEGFNEDITSPVVIITSQPSVWVGIPRSGPPHYSINGTEWHTATAPHTRSRLHLTAVTCGEGLFVAAGNQILTSSDGFKW